MYRRRWNGIFALVVCILPRRTTIETLAKIHEAREALEAKKGEDILVLDVRGLSEVTDYYLIATGNSAPHLKARVPSSGRQAIGASQDMLRRSAL